MSNNLCYELLDIIEHQKLVIVKQEETITKLVNENLEKENMINVLIKDELD